MYVVFCQVTFTEGSFVDHDFLWCRTLNVYRLPVYSGNYVTVNITLIPIYWVYFITTYLTLRYLFPKFTVYCTDKLIHGSWIHQPLWLLREVIREAKEKKISEHNVFTDKKMKGVLWNVSRNGYQVYKQIFVFILPVSVNIFP